MGLGLSIVKKYVEEANGRIWFESEADKGTTFFIEFPLMYTVENPGKPHTD
jgi:signal transduction histidine kinase